MFLLILHVHPNNECSFYFNNNLEHQNTVDNVLMPTKEQPFLLLTFKVTGIHFKI